MPEQLVACVIMRLYRPDIDRVSDAGHLVQLAYKSPEIRIVDDASLVTTERAVIDVVEAHERREQSPVGLGQLLANR